MYRTSAVVTVAVCAFALLSAAPASAGPLVFSENFSAATAGSWLDLGTDNFSEKWLATTYGLSPQATGWTFNGGSLLARDQVTGDQALLLNEAPQHGVAIAVPNFVVGQQYLLTFDHWGDNRPNGSPYVFDVFIDQVLLGQVSRSYGSPGPGATSSFYFTAAQTNGSLQFLDATSRGEASGIIDNIKIEAVPEPASMLLLGTGLAGLVRVARRRRQ